MTGAAYVDYIGSLLLDNAIKMSINEIEARRRTPMTEQSGLNMLRFKRFAQERIVHEVNLPYR